MQHRVSPLSEDEYDSEETRPGSYCRGQATPDSTSLLGCSAHLTTVTEQELTSNHQQKC